MEHFPTQHHVSTVTCCLLCKVPLQSIFASVLFISMVLCKLYVTLMQDQVEKETGLRRGENNGPFSQKGSKNAFCEGAWSKKNVSKETNCQRHAGKNKVAMALSWDSGDPCLCPSSYIIPRVSLSRLLGLRFGKLFNYAAPVETHYTSLPLGFGNLIRLCQWLFPHLPNLYLAGWWWGADIPLQ